MKRFNVRVYGVYVEDGKLLITDEIRFGKEMTKLPGGGLEMGEGIEQCLRREWKEELNVEIEVGNVLFVNPFLQISAFDSSEEVICLYFPVKILEPLRVPVSNKKYVFSSAENQKEQFRWIPLEELNEETFTFPIDKASVPHIKTWAKDQQKEL